MPAEVARRVYEEHKDFYDQLQVDVLREAAKVTVDPDAALALGRARQVNKPGLAAVLMARLRAVKAAKGNV